MNYKNAESLKALLKNYGIKHNIELKLISPLTLKS